MRNKIKKVLGMLIAAAIFMTAETAVFARKAESNEIRFAKGKNSATVRGRLKAGRQAEYLVRGKAGQSLTLAFSSTAGTEAEVFVFSPATSGEGQMGNKRWQIEFDSTGELRISVTCFVSCAYSLKVALKPSE